MTLIKYPPLNLASLKEVWQKYRKTIIGTEFDISINEETSANTLFLRCFIALKPKAHATDLIRFFFAEYTVLEAEITTKRFCSSQSLGVIFAEKPLDSSLVLNRDYNDINIYR